MRSVEEFHELSIGDRSTLVSHFDSLSMTGSSCTDLSVCYNIVSRQTQARTRENMELTRALGMTTGVS